MQFFQLLKGHINLLSIFVKRGPWLCLVKCGPCRWQATGLLIGSLFLLQTGSTTSPQQGVASQLHFGIYIYIKHIRKNTGMSINVHSGMSFHKNSHTRQRVFAESAKYVMGISVNVIISSYAPTCAFTYSYKQSYILHCLVVSQCITILHCE